MKTYLIKRNIPGAEKLTPEQLQGAAAKSNATLAEIGSDKIQWLHSYVVPGGTVCVYQAANLSHILEHAEKSGFPADEIISVAGTINPQTANTA